MLSITKLQNLKSNSQRYKISVSLSDSCYQSQNYKIWKQFTTCIVRAFLSTVLLSITKLQNLKAIHNKNAYPTLWKKVVINHKTTKFESNSQPIRIRKVKPLSCYQSQNYKIWKQFTTYILVAQILQLLLSITKLQNLKAIHN